MAKPDLGLKRQCMSCGAKFYDLSKDPAICPKCGTVYQVAVPGSSRIAAPAVAARKPPPDEEVEAETGDTELVSLEEVEAEENAGDDTAEDETTEGGEDTFLEEEGNDDVSDLIDNDIENEDEER